jgi:hypothetical protein
MPDRSEPIRFQAASQRAAALMSAAETEIANRWTGRSWGEILGSVWNNKTWAAGQGLKVAINMTVGAWIGPLADAGLDKVGHNYNLSLLKQSYALLEDQIKGKAEELVTSTPTVVTGAVAAIREKVMGTARPIATLDIVECVGDIQAKFAELGLRAKNAKAAANNGAWRYCDDIHWAARELAHAQLCQHSVIDDCDKAIAYLTAIRTQAQAAIPNAQVTKAAFQAAAERVVADNSTISHKKHANFGTGILNPFNARTAATSCSKEHCFGEGVRP